MSQARRKTNGNVSFLLLLPGGKQGKNGALKVEETKNRKRAALKHGHRVSYKVSEVAEITGFCREKVYQWIRAGDLKAYVVPEETTVVLHDDLMAFLRRRAA